MEILTRTHPRWDEFLALLEGPDGCDFQQKIPGDAKSITWQCDGRTKTKARAILEKMGGIDVDGTIAAMPEHYCDCEIVFNMEPL